MSYYTKYCNEYNMEYHTNNQFVQSRIMYTPKEVKRFRRLYAVLRPGRRSCRSWWLGSGGFSADSAVGAKAEAAGPKTEAVGKDEA